MIYNKDEGYKVKFYLNPKTGKSDVKKYIYDLDPKEKIKVLKYVEFLRINNGILNEPYSKHIKGKLRELRVDFGKNNYRIFYFTFVNKNIILLHVFLKKTSKTPLIEINKAEQNYNFIINHQQLYE